MTTDHHIQTLQQKEVELHAHSLLHFSLFLFINATDVKDVITSVPSKEGKDKVNNLTLNKVIDI